MLGLAFCTIDMMLVLLTHPVRAQQPVENVYHIKVVTKKGNHFRGVLWDVTASTLYVEHEKRSLSGRIPFANIHKIVLRRKSKKNAMITGAILGGLALGFVTNQSLQKNPTSSPVAYGLTLTFATAGGAALGLLAGYEIGNLKKIVIRPSTSANPEQTLYRQLEPFSFRHQQDIINRIPPNR